MKPLQFVNHAAQEETRDLPLAIRKAIGFQLDRVQRGDMPADFKSMPTVGSGVYEIRVDDEQGSNTGRCFYVAKFEETVWVLHSFVKKTPKTPIRNIQIGGTRYKELEQRLKRRLK
ncbi:MAG: type II toxin-antitoxin system RelE/ParE family toxin [Pseudomonadota bacterium]